METEMCDYRESYLGLMRATKESLGIYQFTEVWVVQALLLFLRQKSCFVPKGGINSWPRKCGFPGHHLFGDSMCMGSVKQKGQSVGMPPYFYGLRFHSLYQKRPCIHVHLLHNLGSDPCLSLSLGAFGGSGVSLNFSCYMEIAHGDTSTQVHTESYTDRKNRGPHSECYGPSGVVG